MNDRSILARQVDLLYRNVVLGQAISIFNGGLLAWLWQGNVGTSTAVFWWLLVATVASGRILLAHRYRLSDEASRSEPDLWLRSALIGAGLAGIVWAAGASLFMFGADDRQLLFTAFVMGGMVAGAVPVLSAHRLAFRLYAWPISCAVFGVGAGTDALHASFAVMVLVFVLGVTRSADHFHNALLDTLRLEHDKDNLLADLTVAKLRAESSALAKARFLANISHELRTPMHGIMGMASLLEMENLNPAQRELVGPLQRSADELLAKIDNMIELSALEAGQIPIFATPFSLPELLPAVLTEHRRDADAKKLELTMHQAPKMPEVVVGDLEKVRKILHHIIDNAIKFTNAGDVDVLARPGESEDGKFRIAFVVRDTGPGIPKADLDRVFEVFNPGDDSSTKRHGGTGIGLPIAHRLTEALGGTLRIESSLGRGTTVTLELPFGLPEH